MIYGKGAHGGSVHLFRKKWCYAECGSRQRYKDDAVQGESEKTFSNAAEYKTMRRCKGNTKLSGTRRWWKATRAK